MPNNHFKKKCSKPEQITAKKSGGSDEPRFRLLAKPPKEGGPAPTMRMAFSAYIRVARIRRRSPGHSLSTRPAAIMSELKALRPNLDLKYQGKFIYEFLRSDTDQVLVNPARAAAASPPLSGPSCGRWPGSSRRGPSGREPGRKS